MKNKNIKIISIKGFTGLLVLMLIVCGIVGGFFILPSRVIEYFWNTNLVSLTHLPTIKIWQASILWTMCLLLFKIYLKDCISFDFQTSANNENIEKVIKELKERELENKD